MDTFITNAPEFLAKMNALSETYKASGITKENISGLVATLMMETDKLKHVSGPEKKELVTKVLFHFIEQIDPGDKDTDFETLLKTLVPSMIDAFSVMLRVKNLQCCFF